MSKPNNHSIMDGKMSTWLAINIGILFFIALWFLYSAISKDFSQGSLNYMLGFGGIVQLGALIWVLGKYA